METGTQASPAAVSNVIPFKRRRGLLEKTMVGDKECSPNAGGLYLSFMETKNLLPGPVRSNSAIRQDRVDSLRRRLRTGLYNISAEQVAKSMLKNQLLPHVLESRKSLLSDVLGTSVTWSRSPVTDEAS